MEAHFFDFCTLTPFFSACILFFGAEITKAYARTFGSGIVPNTRAVLVADLMRARLAPLPRE
jgi:uncharacterized BrkB/YihY/UPF0761 family membrane protein